MQLDLATLKLYTAGQGLGAAASAYGRHPNEVLAGAFDASRSALEIQAIDYALAVLGEPSPHTQLAHDRLLSRRALLAS